MKVPERWDSRNRKKPRDQQKATKPTPLATDMEIESSPILRFNLDQYSKLIKQLNKPTIKWKVDMAGKFYFNTPWIINSCATENIGCNKSFLLNLENPTNEIMLVYQMVKMFQFKELELHVSQSHKKWSCFTHSTL